MVDKGQPEVPRQEPGRDGRERAAVPPAARHPGQAVQAGQQRRGPERRGVLLADRTLRRRRGRRRHHERLHDRRPGAGGDARREADQRRGPRGDRRPVRRLRPARAVYVGKRGLHEQRRLRRRPLGPVVARLPGRQRAGHPRAARLWRHRRRRPAVYRDTGRRNRGVAPRGRLPGRGDRRLQGHVGVRRNAVRLESQPRALHRRLPSRRNHPPALVSHCLGYAVVRWYST